MLGETPCDPAGALHPLPKMALIFPSPCGVFDEPRNGEFSLVNCLDLTQASPGSDGKAHPAFRDNPLPGKFVGVLKHLLSFDEMHVVHDVILTNRGRRRCETKQRLYMLSALMMDPLGTPFVGAKHHLHAAGHFSMVRLEAHARTSDATAPNCRAELLAHDWQSPSQDLILDAQGNALPKPVTLGA